MKKPFFQPINFSEVDDVLTALPLLGCVQKIEPDYLFLKVDDNYIHRIQSLLSKHLGGKIQKPNYFSTKKNHVGAHVSIIYPEETRHSDFSHSIGEEVTFSVENVFSIDIERKRYYALRIHSEKLLAIREQSQLPNPLCFKQIPIGFHITVGVKYL